MQRRQDCCCQVEKFVAQEKKNSALYRVRPRARYRPSLSLSWAIVAVILSADVCNAFRSQNSPGEIVVCVFCACEKKKIDL